MTTNSKQSPAFSRRRRHVRLGGFLLLLALVPVLFLSQIIQYAMPWYLERQGQGIQMEMSAAEVDLLERRIRLIDLRIGPRNGLALHFQEVGAHLNLRALLAGEFPFEDLQLQGGELDLKALQRASLGIGGGNDAQPLKIPEILIHDFKLKRVGQWLGREVMVKRLYLNGLETKPQALTGNALTTRRLRGRIELHFLVGDASVNIEGELGLNGEILNTQVRLRVQGLELDGFEKLFAAGTQRRLAGHISADTLLNLRYNPNEDKIESHLSGVIDTTGFKYQDQALSLALQAQYSGELDIGGSPAETMAKMSGRGLLSVVDLNLNQTNAAGQGWSLQARDARYQGDWLLTDNLQANGTARSATAQLRLDSEQCDITAKEISFGLDYKSGQEPGPLAAITALKVQELQLSFSGATAGKITGRELKARKLILAREFSTELWTVSAAGLATREFVGQPTARLDGVQLKQLRISNQGALAISAGRVKSLEISAEDDTVRLRELELSGMQREQQGAMKIQQLATEQLELQLDGQSLWARRLALAGFRQLSEHHYTVVQLELQSLNSELGMALEARGLRAGELDLDTQATFSSASLGVRRVRVRSGEASWSIQEGQVRELNYAFTGKLNLDTFHGRQVDHQDPLGIQTTIAQPTLEKLVVNFNTGKYQAASIQLAALSATQSSPPARLISAKADLQGLKVDAQMNIDLGSLEVAELQLGAADPPQFSLATLTATVLSYRAGGALSLEAVHLGDPQIVLIQNSGGDLNLPRWPFADTTAAADEEPPAVRITSLTTQGKSSFKFTDEQVKPVYVLRIEPFSLQLDGFNNRRGTAAGHFKLMGQTGTFTNLDISGKSKATGAGLDISLAGKLTGLALKNLSPYTGKYEKFAIREGRGDLTLSGIVRGGELDLQTQVVISKLELEPFYQGDSANPEAEDGSGSLVMALTLLSDKNKTVRLKVPVTGTLADPVFDFSDARLQAVSGVAKGAVMLAFQPLGILVSAAKLVGNLGAMTVEPVLFSPGKAKLGAESITLLDSLADKLQRLPKLKLRICGRSVQADVAALVKKNQQDLITAQGNLAQLRSRVVRAYLEQKKLVAARQLETLCADQDQDSEDAKPRAVLKLDTRALNGQTGAAKPAAVAN